MILPAWPFSLLVAQLLPSTLPSVDRAGEHHCSNAMVTHMSNDSAGAFRIHSVQGRAQRARAMPDTSAAGDGHKEGDRMGYVWTIGVSLVLWVASMAYAEAASYYVSPSGGGSTCSSGAPCSLNTGVNQAQCGDTLFLKGGNYGTQRIGPEHGGPSLSSCASFSNTVTIRPAPGESPTMRTIDMTGSSHVIVNGENRLVIDGLHQEGTGIFGSGPYRVMNFEVRNQREQGAYGCDEGSCEFINMHIHHIAYRDGTGHTCTETQHGANGYCHGIYIHADNVLVDGGKYHHIGGYGVHPNPGNNWIIRNITVHNNWDGFLAYGSGHLVYNNISYNNAHNGLNVFGNDNQIYNNTIVGGVLYVRDNGNRVQNNIATGGIENLGSNTLSNNLQSDPGFVNAAGDNFRIATAGSPAIDTGVGLRAVTTDFDKRPRPQGARFDIGAYEYTGSAPRPLSAPTNLRIAGR
jgi:hypothetical protein